MEQIVEAVSNKTKWQSGTVFIATKNMIKAGSSKGGRRPDIECIAVKNIVKAGSNEGDGSSDADRIAVKNIAKAGSSKAGGSLCLEQCITVDNSITPKMPSNKEYAVELGSPVGRLDSDDSLGSIGIHNDGGLYILDDGRDSNAIADGGKNICENTETSAGVTGLEMNCQLDMIRRILILKIKQILRLLTIAVS